MPKSSNQKLKLLYLLDFLMRETDEEHPSSTKEIIEYLSSIGINAERKTIYSDIEALKLFGTDIESNGKGYYVASREFELPELKMLADCVSASKFITDKKSRNLIKKIESLTSRFEAAMLQRQVFTADGVKGGNESIYYSVDTVSDAVNAGKKIAFKYFTYDTDKKRCYKNDGEDYVVTPYSLAVSDENYYLISYYPKHEKLTHFRVDRMSDIRVMKEDGDKAENVMGKGFSIGEYSKKIFSMFPGESERVSLLCDDSLINAVIDRFGEGVFIQKGEEGKFLVSANVDISPTFFAWVFTFGGKMKIVSPEKVKDEFNNTLKKFME